MGIDDRVKSRIYIVMKKQRILVISHAHPDFSIGGGEIAAYNLFKAYKNNPDVDDAWFLARFDRQRGANGAISKRRDNEYLWEQGISDWHNMKASHLESVTTWFTDLIRRTNPTVVHTHHYAHLGLEYLQIIKQIDPSIRIVLTLHEYMAICSNNGQMIKVGSMNLCSRSSPDECRQCFPDKSAEDHWLRKHRFIRYFDLVDQFVSPSEFLRQRYIDWGISPAKIIVIENGQSANPSQAPRSVPEGAPRNRFGFFGQINPYKGLDVLLEAIHRMSIDERKSIALEVHGANLESQSENFRLKIETLLKPLVEEGTVQMMGPYQPHELRNRMANVDWVCVSSVWWENSPMVIQEAFSNSRPLLVSDIGGMAEKVRHEVDGLLVPAGNAWAWCTALLRAGRDSKLFTQCHQGIRRPLSHDECAALHLQCMPTNGTTRSEAV